ncbi:TetR/AcrR family transcriptional regulator [Williamsia sp. CHRR-6]|uniref:TetR/AcrR family transcriptional regulator n=1 Tax=Williamsia sp. CHRR-6 TaxID=2835871 RepID=UPI001BD9E4EA|nr:TetR/AcrR family transcriptional regulator [Williamsia sp. CHRR-6]MBT0567008.1 TetR/AcrR family transcriptional regulator C-terminal ligand-binding domain-containing protein [Williamsia sp. CHRR-6]
MTAERRRAARPGGRSARVQSDVHAAVGALVSEGHRYSMTIPQVAERAGVNPTSIYRRWGTIDVLLGEVAVAALTGGAALPDTGGLRGDLQQWARAIAADITRPERTTYLRAVVGARDGAPDRNICFDERAEQVQSMLSRAAERGESGPTVDQVLDHAMAPLYHRVLFGLPVNDEVVRRLVSDVMALAPVRA